MNGQVDEDTLYNVVHAFAEKASFKFPRAADAVNDAKLALLNSVEETANTWRKKKSENVVFPAHAVKHFHETLKKLLEDFSRIDTENHPALHSARNPSIN